MDDDKNNQEPNTEVEEISEEEKKSEAEALAEVKDEELKSKIAEDLGISPEDEPELIDKVVEREKAQREKLSGAIKQKISWREKATKKTSEKPKDTPEDGKPPTTEDPVLTAEMLDQKLDEREAKRDLESLNLPEEIEKEVKDLAKVKGISVREAAKLPYIVSTIEEAEKEERVKSASPKRRGRGSYAASHDPSKPLNPDDFALDTKKGRKEWKEAKATRREFEKQQQ